VQVVAFRALVSRYRETTMGTLAPQIAPRNINRAGRESMNRGLTGRATVHSCIPRASLFKSKGK
jgi:hypothetical protein